MELDKSYNLDLLDIEYPIRQIYKEGIKKLRETDDSFEELKVLNEIHSALVESTPGEECLSGWYKDFVKAQKNLGKIFNSIYSELETELEDFVNMDIILEKYSINDVGNLEKELLNARKFSELEKDLKDI